MLRTLGLPFAPGLPLSGFSMASHVSAYLGRVRVRVRVRV